MHAEQGFQVVVPYVLEIPSGAVIARHPRFPAWVMHGRLAIRQQRVDGHLIGHVRECQAFGREADAASPCIVQWTQVRANAVVM